MQCTFRPIERWPRKETPAHQRKRSPFKATWERTLIDLDRELVQLDAKHVVIQADVDEKGIRLDGMLRSAAAPRSPRVILSFEGKHGHVSMPCDTFAHWKENIRAITLTLANLRAIDRYGVTTHGEQYTGWKQIEGRVEPPAKMTIEEAASFLVIAAEKPPVVAPVAVGDSLECEIYYRKAARRLHPDAGGDRAKWDLLQEAIGVLRRHHGVAR